MSKCSMYYAHEPNLPVKNKKYKVPEFPLLSLGE